MAKMGICCIVNFTIDKAGAAVVRCVPMPLRYLVPIALLACSCLVAPLVFGQVETARITGTVKDQTGAVLPGAKVTILNTDTNIPFVSASDASGHYDSMPVKTGRYRVAVENPGFKRAVRDGIVLQIQQTVVVDFTLELGAQSVEVSITDTPPLLTMNEPTQGQVIDNQKMVDLPLNGRNYFQLALLTSGTNTPPPTNRTGGFSSSGMRITLNDYLLDGVDNNCRQLAASARQAETIRPSVDAIQEFKVMTNSFSAEYGRAGGAVVNAILKSGTNEIRGTAFEFARNEVFDAKNLFDRPQDPKPPFKRNQFGGSLGGPILRSKTFFFGDYEATRIRESRTVNNTIPTQRMAGGDFSELLPAERIYDPETYNAATNERQPFPGNAIPASRIDPVAAKAIRWYPEPNRPGLTNNFLYNPPDRDGTDRWDAKIDHTFGASDNLFGRFSFQRAKSPASPALPLPAVGGGLGGNGVDFQHDGRNFVLAHNHIFSPSLINSLKLGWNRIFTDREAPVRENLNAAIGLKGVNTSLPGSANFAFTGTAYVTLGAGLFSPNYSDSQTRQLINDLTWIRGRHSVKLGINFSWFQGYESNATWAVGNFEFDGRFTRNTRSGKEGDEAADFLLGLPYKSQYSNVAYVNQRSPSYDAYLQDEWRVTPRLTLNLGLRYELRLPWVETRNGWANFDIDTDPGNARLVLARDGSRFDRATVRTDANNFGPRLGFAYRATDRTVLRGGYGVYYVPFEPFGDSEYLHTNPPFHYKSELLASPLEPLVRLRDGLPPDMLDPRKASDLVTSSFDRGGRLPYAQQWSFSIQRELPGETLFEIGYFANTAHKLTRRLDGNWALPGPGALNPRRRYRSVLEPRSNMLLGPLGRNYRHEAGGNANFHSMQTKVEKRLSHGFSLLASYIWAKAISDSRGATPAGGSSATDPQDPRNLRAERSLADEHCPHRFVASYIYDMPFGRGRKHLAKAHPAVEGLLGGWSFAGITTLSSGGRASPGVPSRPSNTGDADRPNVLHDWRLPKDQRSLSRWFDTTAFSPNSQYTFGNAARNLIEGPGLVNFDFAVYKHFQVRERLKWQFRAEAFNLLNTPPLLNPNVQVGARNFGVISSAGRPRALQFGLKLIF